MKNQNGRIATWRGNRVLFIVQAGVIAAVYVALTVVLAPFSFREIQVRVAEALTILPFFMPAAVPGLLIGCLIGNTLGGAVLPDIVFGSLATLIGAVGTYLIGRAYWKSVAKKRTYSQGEYINAMEVDARNSEAPKLAEIGSADLRATTRSLIIAAIPPIVANALIVPFVLRYAYGVPMAIPLMMLTVGLGEVISCGILGVLLGRAVHRVFKAQ